VCLAALPDINQRAAELMDLALFTIAQPTPATLTNEYGITIIDIPAVKAQLALSLTLEQTECQQPLPANINSHLLTFSSISICPD